MKKQNLNEQVSRIKVMMGLKEGWSNPSNFIQRWNDELESAVRKLSKVKPEDLQNLSPEKEEKLQKKLMTYDDNVLEFIEDMVYNQSVDKDEIVDFALDNEDKFGTEPQFVIFAIDDFTSVLGIYDDEEYEDDDTEEYSDEDSEDEMSEGLDLSKMNSFKGIDAKSLNDCVVSNNYPIWRQIDLIQNQKYRDMIMNSCKVAIDQKNDGKALECAFFISQMVGLINAGAVDKTWINTTKCLQQKIKLSMTQSSNTDIIKNDLDNLYKLKYK